MKQYQHYKGGIYTLLSTSVYHTETNERLAVYENSKGEVFARPYDMFFGEVEVDGVMVPRFKEIPKVSAKKSKPKENYMKNLLKKYGRNKKL